MSRQQPPEEDPLEYDPFVEATKARERRREEFDIDVISSEAQIPDEEELPPPQPVSDPFSSQTRVSSLDARSLFDDLDALPGGSTKVVPAQPGTVPTGLRDSATKVVARPAPLGERTRIAVNPGQEAAPLNLDFSEVLPTAQIAGAQRIGGESLASDEFMDKYDRQALDRAQASPEFSLPSSIERDAAASPVRIVEQKGRVWVWALAAILIPAVIAVIAVAVYVQLNRPTGLVDLEKVRQAEEANRKAQTDHEKEMAR